jgi:hypothetical protein
MRMTKVRAAESPKFTGVGKNQVVKELAHHSSDKLLFLVKWLVVLPVQHEKIMSFKPSEMTIWTHYY